MMTSPETLRLIQLRDDFEYCASTLFKVAPKGSAHLLPFTLMSGQKYIHDRLEAQRRSRKLVRAIIVKPRQIGATSYLAARNAHRAMLNPGVRAFLVAHDLKIAQEVLGKVQAIHADMPPRLQVKADVNNTTDLSFGGLRSWFKIATANRPDVGRGMSPTILHGSEVAYWHYADEIMAGLSTGVAWAPGTEIVLESTAAGPEGFFYEEAMKANAGESDYELIFVPWHWQTEYARTDFPPDWKPSHDELELQAEFKLSKAQLWWRNRELTKKSITAFRREFPATLSEAFMADVEGALWKRADIKVHNEAMDGPLPPIVRRQMI
jgi:hypothetical protein